MGPSSCSAFKLNGPARWPPAVRATFVGLTVVLAIAGILSWCPPSCLAEEPTYIARDFPNVEATGVLPVIELPDPLPTQLYRQACVISWTDAAGQPQEVVHYLRGGQHPYEVRQTGAWKGQLARVSIAMPIGDAAISFEPAGPREEWDVFLASSPITAHTMNVESQPIYLLAYRWEIWLVLGAVLVAFVVRRQGGSWGRAAVIGFVCAWALQDLRTTYRHAVVSAETDRYPVTITQLELDRPDEQRSFTARVADVIGRGTWSMQEPFPGYDRQGLRYSLAERRFEPDPERADFVITYDRPWGETVVQQDKYRLGRRP